MLSFKIIFISSTCLQLFSAGAHKLSWKTKLKTKCHFKFSQERNLKTHINAVHSGEKDHKCDTCGKSFSEARNLKIHINVVHNGQKYHKCDICGKSFADKLRRHINSVHNRQKDHKCASCGKLFS